MCEVRSRIAAGVRLLPLIVVLLIVGLFTGSAMAQTGALSGVVTDADTGEPVEGALVLVHADGGMAGPQLGGRRGSGSGGGGQGSLHATTNELGAYLFEALAAGDYSVNCGKIGYEVAHAAVTIEDGQTTTLDFVLVPLAFGSVSGLVTDDLGAPIVGARVVLSRLEAGEAAGGSGGSGGSGSGGSGGSGGGMCLNALTGEDGTYAIDNVPVGDYEAVAMAYGYTTSDPVPVTVVEGVATENVDFVLVPLTYGSLEGFVTDQSTGVPIEGARVMASQHLPGTRPPSMGGGGGWSNVAETDEAGFYRFEELAAGTWTVRSTARGYMPFETEIEIVTDTTTGLDIALEPR